ncbi:hypothetical protein DFH28DRAFT_926641 [Melampsora americana]|nr:hypothetical protein DFH28DRAFT_926641 [Melampsora americana]
MSNSAFPTSTTPLLDPENAKHHELYELRNTQAYRTLNLFERRGEQCIVFHQGHRPLPKLLAERGTLEAHDLSCGSAQDSADPKASQDCSQLSLNKTSDPGHQQSLHTAGHTLVNETPTPKERNNDSTDTGQPDLEDEPFEMDPEIWVFLLDEQQQYPDFWLARNS